MSDAQLKAEILEQLMSVADRHDFVRSVTVTGSFVDSPTLDGISDIDCVVVVDHLNATRYDFMLAEFDAALRGVFATHGYEFRINSTLGPLKYNAPRLAVLHLMLYSNEARVRHAQQSPFTCLDWQRSSVWRKNSLAKVYPVFGLQPRHFLGARRGLRDYLDDLRNRVVSYRELVCTDDGYSERKLSKPMTVRDRHEFAYHVMRFLMSNFLKLITRTNRTQDNETLLTRYFDRFPDGAATFVPFFRALAAKKKRSDFSEPVQDIESTLEHFAAAMETQFRQTFFANATRHTAFRHAPTKLNDGVGKTIRFQGQSNEPILPVAAGQLAQIVEAVAAQKPLCVFSSPALRATQSLAQVARECAIPKPIFDARLLEMNYGQLEGLSVGEARVQFPEVFQSWAEEGDPRLPDGESVADVAARVASFAREIWAKADGPSLTCTHNVVLRCLIGSTLGVPQLDWHRLQIPHLAPVTFVQTANDGLFVDIPETVQADMFALWEPASLRKAA